MIFDSPFLATCSKRDFVTNNINGSKINRDTLNVYSYNRISQIFLPKNNLKSCDVKLQHLQPLRNWISVKHHVISLNLTIWSLLINKEPYSSNCPREWKMRNKNVKVDINNGLSFAEHASFKFGVLDIAIITYTRQIYIYFGWFEYKYHNYQNSHILS